MTESPPAESSAPLLHIDLSQVCVVDGIWQDMPDHMAAFDEARLVAALTIEEATAVHGRGNLYVLLDVSGDVEGRDQVERDVIETIRREYALRRGSITFGLSEALRAANLALFDSNLQLSREARRMAGVCAAALRGHDLYIAAAGPAVAYAEIDGELKRFPPESDWFSEDAPLYSPQGAASAPLGVRHEFACDLFHVSVEAGDVFILATRALTQLAGKEELAHAISNRGAEDIAGYLEEIANGADLSALVGELVDPRDLKGQPARPEPENVLEPAAPEPAAPAVVANAGERDQGEDEFEIPWTQAAPEFQPIYEAQAEPVSGELEPETLPAAGPPPDELARVRAERQARRREQMGAVGRGAGRALRGGVGLLAGALLAAGAGFGKLAGLVNWDRAAARINRAINTFFLVIWRALALLVRLALPGAPGKQSSLIPRRASKEPVWLRVLAVLLPLLLIGLALDACYVQGRGREDQSDQLAGQAQALLTSAKSKIDIDRPAARGQLDQALVLVKQARGLYDSPRAQGIYNEIQDQMNAANGISVLYDIAPIAALTGEANPTQIVADDNDIYVFDRAAERILGYRINNTATKSEPLGAQGVILQRGGKAGTLTVDTIRDMAWADGSGNARGGIVAVTGSAMAQFDSQANSWRVSPIQDVSEWGAIRLAAGFMGNLYLLDATRNQIWKYRSNGGVFGPTGSPYFPANAGVDLSHAVDLAIDSDVWVLTDEGKVMRFQSGQRLPFELTGIQPPLSSPTGIYARQGVDALYIVDSGNARIAQFDKNGRFVRQFKPRGQDSASFVSLKALSANEAKKKFYLTNASGVFLASIP